MGGVDAQPLHGISILIVDDNADALDLLRTALTYYGALTVTATDGKEGLARLRSARVHVIISDISMPGFSGHDFIRAVRALPDEAVRNTPAIALTAFNEPHQWRSALEACFPGYLLEPVEPRALVPEVIPP